jgi:hypothetical protein
MSCVFMCWSTNAMEYNTFCLPPPHSLLLCWFCPQEGISKWRELNTAAHWTAAATQLHDLCQSLPQLLHHKQTVLGVLLGGLEPGSTLSWPPFFDLLTALARDLQGEAVELLPAIMDRWGGCILLLPPVCFCVLFDCRHVPVALQGTPSCCSVGSTSPRCLCCCCLVLLRALQLISCLAPVQPPSPTTQHPHLPHPPVLLLLYFSCSRRPQVCVVSVTGGCPRRQGPCCSGAAVPVTRWRH